MGAGHDSNGPPRAVVPRAVKGVDVVDDREIAGRDGVRATRARVRGPDAGVERRPREVVQRDHSGYEVRQGARNRRRPCVALPQHAVHVVVVDLGVERPLNVRNHAAEVDPGPPLSDLLNNEPFRGQPVGDHVDCFLRWPEPLAILLRGQPPMEVRRVGVLLLGEELIQRRLLLRRHPEGKDHALHRQRKLDGASVEFGPGERVNVTAQDDSVAVVYRLRQTGRKTWGGGRNRQANHEDDYESDSLEHAVPPSLHPFGSGAERLASRQATSRAAPVNCRCPSRAWEARATFTLVVGTTGEYSRFFLGESPTAPGGRAAVGRTRPLVFAFFSPSMQRRTDPWTSSAPPGAYAHRRDVDTLTLCFPRRLLSSTGNLFFVARSTLPVGNESDK